MTTVALEARGVVTPERFARGMTIAQYLDFIGTFPAGRFSDPHQAAPGPGSAWTPNQAEA